jgi:hypothetical protein
VVIKWGEVMTPIRAKYGANDNSHKLLSCSDESVVLPLELEGLTDRPPGDAPPGEIWWPSVGCGPVDGFWCIWWTEPDNQTVRTGMVKSEVALWPLEKIDAVDDLLPALCEISKKKIRSASEELLVPITDVLLSNQGKTVIVCESLEEWPGVIAGLWCRLWSTARMDFSARIALSPPQNDTDSSPWLLGIPKNRAQQWQAPYVKVSQAGESYKNRSFSRASYYIAGREDKTLSRVLDAFPKLAADFSFLKRIVRMADSLDSLEEKTNFDDAVALLRTLTSMSPEGEIQDFEKQAVTIINEYINKASFEQIIAISNIPLPDLSASSELKDILREWVFQKIPKLVLERTTLLPRKLLQGQAQPWWQSVVQEALIKGFKTLTAEWIKVILLWLSIQELEPAIDNLIPKDETLEDKLFLTAFKNEWKEANCTQLRYQAIKRDWPILHAWAAVLTQPISEAFESQFGFKNDFHAGLQYLVNSFPAIDVVKEAIIRNDCYLTNLVTQLTQKDAELLSMLNIKDKSSRRLWAKHIEAGGHAWPSCFKPEIQGKELLDLSILGQDTFSLIEILAEDFAPVVLDYPSRDKVWDSLTPVELGKLVQVVSELMVNKLNEELNIPEPERILAEAVYKIMQESIPSANAVVSVFSWNISISESDAVKWVKNFNCKDWKRFATDIGQITKERSWSKMADELNNIRCSIYEAREAIEICSNLLSWWQQKRLSWGKNSADDESNLIIKISEIGAELYTDSLGEVWERAGGERQLLDLHGSAKTQWQNAVRKARDGGVPGGLLNLLNEMKRDYPYNSELIELEILLQ